MFQVVDRYFKLPPVMRAAYGKNLLDHFFARRNLSRLLAQSFPNRSAGEIESAVRESLASEALATIRRNRHAINGALSEWKLVFLRSVIRLAEPQSVVETGVANGSSSAVILEALERNGPQGRLYSIDLPIQKTESGALKSWQADYAFHPDDISTVSSFERVGWLVDPKRRGRWRLILGDSLRELPKLLAEIQALDIFIHDSVHQYDHMHREFETAWPVLKPGGLLLSDDVFLKNHTALHDFACARNLRFDTYHQMGILRKP